MSDFTPPTLVTNLSTTAYRTQLNSNFATIEQAFRDVSNTLPKTTLTPNTNVSWVDRATRPSGIIGKNAFYPILGTDHSRFAVAHNGPDSVSACVIGNNYHSTDRSFSKTFEEIGITGSGDYVVNFGVRSVGAPLLEMLLEENETDQLQTLTIWRMNVNRNLGVFTVTNLRLMCDLLMDQETFVATYHRDMPLSCSHEGVLPTTSERVPAGILIPWNCEIQRAFVRLETPPLAHTDQNTIEIMLARVMGTDYENVLASTASFAHSDAAGTTRTLEAISNPGPYQAQEGEYVYPLLLSNELDLTDFPPQAAGLSVTLLVKQIHHGIYR